MDISAVCSVAEKTMRVVGARIRDAVRNPAQLKVMEKSGRELVTEIDIWSENIIVEDVGKRFPGHAVIGEETIAEHSKKTGKDIRELTAKGICWVVDPLDGTTNFTNGIPHVAVSIGILADGKQQAGFIYDPVRDEFFSAVLGQGAFLNGARIQVSGKKQLRDSVVVTGFPYDRYLRWTHYRAAYEAIFQASRDLRRTGSAALDQCWVACGRFDGFFEYSLRPWDVAAGSLIVEEAGGRIGNLDPQYAKTGFSLFAESFVFSGPHIFAEMVRLGNEAETKRDQMKSHG